MPGGVWGQQVRNQNQGFYGYNAPRPASAFDNANVLLRGGGSPSYGGRGDGSVQKRQFADVGKVNLNLLDPLDQSRAAVNYQPIDGTDGGLLGLGNYYNAQQPGGLFAGLFGGIGQTVAGIFGEGAAKTGSDVGTFLGKTLEMPLAAVGSAGVPFIAPVIDAANSEIEKVTPYILRDTLKIPTNIGGAFQSLLNIFGLAGMAVERTYAGMDARGALPEDIEARLASGELKSRDEAFDEMVLTSRGYSNDVMHNLGWNLLLDPANWVSLGVGTVGGAVRGTGTLARAFSAGVRASPEMAARAAAAGGKVAELGEMAQRGEAITGMVDSRGLMNQMRTVIDDPNARFRLSYIERLGMSALGPVSDDVANPILRVGNLILKATDPVNFFSGSKAGQRSMELISVAASTGVMAAYKPMVVLGMAGMADKILEGGADRIWRSIAINGGNALQEYGLSDLAQDAAKSGAIPMTGKLTPTQAIREILKGGGYDTNVGKYVELLVERNKDIAVTLLSKDEMYEETVNKFAALLGVDSGRVRAVMKSVSQDDAVLVHALYYYRKGEVLHTDVLRALRGAKTAGTLPAHIDPELIAIVGPRTLTDLTVKEVDDALASGDLGQLRTAVEKYESFNWVNSKNVPDTELRASVENWLEVNRPHLIKETPLTDPTTGQLLAGLPQELVDWASDSTTFGYKLGQKLADDVAPDAMWRVTRAPGNDGEILNANPYSDFVVEGGDHVKRLNIFSAAKMAAFRSIRQERIVWAQRRRFITDMAKGSEDGGVDIPPALADRIFKALMYEAKDRYIQPRGMEPAEMYTTARRVLDDARKENAQYGDLTTKLTERQVVLTLLRATNGDVGLVGVTQKVTGSIKAYAPGSGANYWGRISERLYPLMRFTLNPVFQTMELMEPYVLNTMRGVFTPLRRDSEGYQQALATHNAIFQLIHASTDHDGIAAETAEALAMQAYQGSEAAAKFGRNRISRWMPHIGERKTVAAALETERIMGDHFYRAFKEILGDRFEAFWADRERDFGTTNRGQIAKRWAAANFALQDVNGFQVATIDDILKAKNVGKRMRLNKNGVLGAYTFADVETVFDHVRRYDSSWTQGLRGERNLPPGQALLEDLKAMSREEWHEEVNRSGLNADGIERLSMKQQNDIWLMANGPELDDFWNGEYTVAGQRHDGYRKAYLSGVTGEASHGAPAAVWTRLARDQEVAAARAFVKGWADNALMTEEEFIKLHFEDIPRALAGLSALVSPGSPLSDILTEVREEWSQNAMSHSYGNLGPVVGLDIRNATVLGHVHPSMVHLDEAMATDEYYLHRIGAWALENIQEHLNEGIRPYVGDVPNHGYVDANVLLDEVMQGEHIVRVRRDKVDSHGNLFKGINLVDRYSNNPDNWELLTDEGWQPVRRAKGGNIQAAEPVPRRVNSEIKTGQSIYAHSSTVPTNVEARVYKVDVEGTTRTPEEMDAIKFYTESGYDQINPFLRGTASHRAYASSYGMKTVAELREYIRLLDHAVAKGQTRERQTLYRGINISRMHAKGEPLSIDYENMKVGQTFRDPAFFSSATQESAARSFAGYPDTWDEYAPDHVGVMLYIDTPAGTHIHYEEGFESEILWGRGVEFRVTKVKVKTGSNTGTIHHIHIEPISEPVKPGVNRLSLGEMPVELRNEGRMLQDATQNPERLRGQVHLPHNDMLDEDTAAMHAADIETAITKAEAAKPPVERVTYAGQTFGRKDPRTEGLAEIRDLLDSDEIEAGRRSTSDVRQRVDKVMESELWSDPYGPPSSPTYGIRNQNNNRLLSAIAAGVVGEGSFRGGLRKALRAWEALWSQGPRGVTDPAVDDVTREMGTHLARGISYAIRQPVLTNSGNDGLDAVLDNTTRRATGRADDVGPVLVDDTVAEAAGYYTPAVHDELVARGVHREVAAPVGRSFESWEDVWYWAEDNGFATPREAMTKEQRSAVYHYTGLGSNAINRAGEGNAELDSLMKPIPEPIVVTRSMKNADAFPGFDLDTVQVGNDLVAPYYLSTSAARASQWGFPYRLEITVGEGTPAFWADPHSSVQGEAEMLVGRNQALRVTKITEENGVKVIHVTTRPEIPPTGAAGAPVPAPVVIPPKVFAPGVRGEQGMIAGNDAQVGGPKVRHPEARGTFDEPEGVGVTRAGVVIKEADGRVWIFEPTNHYGGYEHTWPKGGPDPGEDWRDAALREVEEEMGFTVRLTGHIGDFTNVQGTSRARFYTAERTGGGPEFARMDETATIKLVTPEDARSLLIHDGVPDARDHAILDAATKPAEAAPAAAVPPTTAIPTGTLEPTHEYLGGSTGARQMRDPETGKLYVDKEGNHPEHVRSESAADRVYEALGLPVAPHVLMETPSGPVKRAEMIEGAQQLRDFVRTASPEEVEAVYAQLREHYALHALISNWDVLGLDGDNVIVKNGVPYLIDNGGSFLYRAQGKAKGEAFGTTVTEIVKLRDPDYAEWGHRVFKDVTDGMLRRQVLDLGPQMDTILDNAPPELRELLLRRYQDMLDQTADMTPDPASAVAPTAALPATGIPSRPAPLGEYEHEYIVAYFNDMAKAANEEGFNGRSTWTAQEMASVASLARVKMGRRGGVPMEAYELHRAMGQIKMAFTPGVGMEKYAPLFDILNQKRYRAERQAVIRAGMVSVYKALRDDLGLIIERGDPQGIGLFDGDAPSALFSVSLLASPEHQQTVAEALAYITGQPLVRTFRLGPDPSDIDDIAAYTPRASVYIPPTDLTPRMAERIAEAVGKAWPEADNVTATRGPNGAWHLQILDHDGTLFPRRGDGYVDEEALNDMLSDIITGPETGLVHEGLQNANLELAVEYGHLGEAQPPRITKTTALLTGEVEGDIDWGLYAQQIETSSTERGAPVRASTLRDIRAAYHRDLKTALRKESPEQYARLDNDTPVSGRNLEDRRGGDVLGATSPQSSTTAIIRGFAQADALTGLHELIHVFSISGTDPSLREVVSKAYDEYHVGNDAAKTARIAILHQKEQATTSTTWRNRYRNERLGLEQGLQNPHPSEWSKEHEEFFVHLILDWIDRGVPGNPELANAANHFRNWITVTRKSLSKPGLAPIPVSPQMDALLSRMFQRPGVDTVPYSVEQQALRMAGQHAIRGAWDEAHSTHYYKKDRSMAERSINHPYIGLYPASYMWGKILPEMVRFLALRPFGMETPFLAWNVAREVSDSVRAQGELDPGFKDWLDGNEDAFMLFSMLFPGLPHDIPANASLPVRRIAEQGLESQAQYAAGVDPSLVKDIDFAKGSQDAIQYALGPLGAIRTSSEIVGMGGNLVRSVLGETVAKPAEPSEHLPLR